MIRDEALALQETFRRPNVAGADRIDDLLRVHS